MPRINAQLSVEPTGGDLVTLMITDAYGHINGRIELNPTETGALITHLQSFLPIDVEAVVVEDEPGVDVEAVVVEDEPGVDWEALTKAEIIDKVNELYDILLDADDTKAKLVAQAKDLEAQLA